MQTTLGDLTTFSALAEKTGISERTFRYWLAVNLGNFADCTLRVGGRRLVNLPATQQWLERLHQGDAVEQRGA